MKFIITESQFEKAVGSYLNYLLDEYEHHGNYYFAYKDSKLMQLKCNDFNGDNNIHVKMSSHIINDIKSMFSIDHDASVNAISKWIENKTNKEVIGVTKTPYSQDLPLLVRR